ncbi:MAG TPA: hypothetical protein VGQ46_13775 [Thermoanaerobaculia bacterium]|jgi:hypothetical protein|nr:hypothetical protein [Thermoanaerobaculia bacterium]
MKDRDFEHGGLDRVPLPTIPLTDRGLGDATIAENADELLYSFGADAGSSES